MKSNKKQDFKKCGIYCIKNKINNKVYIGKSKNIYSRIKQHITLLNTKSKDENRYLIHSWFKYGRESFTYEVLEYFDIVDEKVLKERELHWITYYDSTNRDKGYNLRMDSETKCIVSNETRLKLSESQKRRYINNPDSRRVISETNKKYWSNPDNVKNMIKTLKETKKKKYKFLQYDKENNFLKEWDSVEEIISNNPNFKWQNIYSVCNDYKKSYMGFIWKKEFKI
jgi:group I intron endonuclease